MLADRPLIQIAVNSMTHQAARARQMRAGLARHGITAEIVGPSGATAPIVICWGWRTGSRLRHQGHEVLVMERGYAGNRFAWTSLGWNGLNGRAEFCLKPPPSRERWDRHFAPLIKPWKTGGDCIVVMGQVPGDMACRNVSMMAWAARSMKQLKAMTELPVYFRSHPRYSAGALDPKPAFKGDLNDALTRAAAVITWNSNSGVDAVLAGVPTVAMDVGSMVYGVAAHELTPAPPRPDRDWWTAALAWCQWSDEEIVSGQAWEFIGRDYRDRAALAET